MNQNLKNVGQFKSHSFNTTNWRVQSRPNQEVNQRAVLKTLPRGDHCGPATEKPHSGCLSAFGAEFTLTTNHFQINKCLFCASFIISLLQLPSNSLCIYARVFFCYLLWHDTFSQTPQLQRQNMRTETLFQKNKRKPNFIRLPPNLHPQLFQTFTGLWVELHQTKRGGNIRPQRRKKVVWNAAEALIWGN